MNGNSFYRKLPRTLDSRKQYKCSAKSIDKNLSRRGSQISIEEFQKEIVNDFMDNHESSSIELQKNSTIPTQDNSVLKDKQDIRMQEIEEYILANSTVRNINGDLCMWNGSFYKQLDLRLFTQEARRILPQSSQKRISHFNRFKEAYEYMQANININTFSERDVLLAKNMIAFRNTLYEARTRKLYKKTPAYPILFDIDASYLGEEKLDTPCFDRIINHASGYDEEVLKLCYQIIGYILSQGNEAKKFFVFGTAPDSGKSIIGEFIAKVLGADNVSTIALSDFGGRFALGTINQRVLNYNMDLPATELDKNSIQKLKQLTGDPRVECEVKYVQGKTAVHHCKLLFATNHPIRLKYEDSAFFNRLILVPFINSVDEHERDYNLLHKLWEERDAIATKAAHAYSELIENNFVFQKSVLADSMLCQWRDQYDNEQLRYFLIDRFEFADANSFVPTETIFRMYQEYCHENGLEIMYSEKNQFSRRFHTVSGLESTKKRVGEFQSAVNGYLGIRASDL